MVSAIDLFLDMRVAHRKLLSFSKIVKAVGACNGVYGDPVIDGGLGCRIGS